MRVTTCFLVAVISALSMSALGQPIDLVQKPAPALGASPATPAPPAVKYDGLVPGPDAKNPLPQAPTGGPYLVWTGFQMTDTGSRVFLQTTKPVAFDVAHAKGKASKSALEILLRGCRIHMANNRRKIDTRYFATPVASVSARQKGRDVEVRIAVRQEVSVFPRAEEGTSGTQFVVIDFPPGKAETNQDAVRPRSERAAFSDGEPVRTDDQDGAPPAGPARKRSRSER